jgi:lantibiotic biosynthesis protein
MIQIFPHILARICGGSITEFNSLIIEETGYHLSKITSSHKEFLYSKTAIVDLITRFIKEVETSTCRKLLIQLKREILQDKLTLANVLIKESVTTTPTALQNLLSTHVELCNEFICETKTFSDFYIEESIKSEQCLLNLLQKDDFQKGLVMSSMSMYEATNKYIRHNANIDTAKKLKIQRSAVKYLSRFYTKTSPFSTFTQVTSFPIKFKEPTVASVAFSSFSHSDNTTVSKVRINGFLLQYLTNLIVCSKIVSPLIKVRLNPTLQTIGSSHKFLTSNGGTEAFQQINVTPVTNILISIFNSTAKPLTIKDTARIIDDSALFSSNYSDVCEYLFQLVYIGFLEFDLGVSAINPSWDLQFVELINSISAQVPSLARLASVMESLRDCAERFYSFTAIERSSRLLEIHTALKNTCLSMYNELECLPEYKSAIGVEFNRSENMTDIPENSIEVNADSKTQAYHHTYNTTFWFRPENILFEDVKTSIKCDLPEELTVGFVATISDMLHELSGFTYNSREELLMLSFFKNNYMPSAYVDVLEFHDAFYRSIKETLNTVSDNNTTAFLQMFEGYIETISNYSSQWSELFMNHIKDRKLDSDYTLHIYKYDLIKVNKLLPRLQKNSIPNSRSVFMQVGSGDKTIFNNRHGAFIVLNSLMDGYGKLFSRFVHLFDENMQNDLLTNNKLHTHGVKVIENIDSSFYNGNIHSPLFDYEISVPGSHNILEEDRRVHVKNLQICLSQANDGERLLLVEKNTKNQCYMVDLGFQGISSRTNLFKLLNYFSPTKNIRYRVLLDVINSIFAKSDKNTSMDIDAIMHSIVKHPRVVYENLIILQRKKWVVGINVIPKPDHFAPPSDYFIHINNWRTTQGIPDEVFVRIYVKDEEIEDFKRKDDYKPQYINFYNPYLVNIFVDIIKRATSAIVIEEMLPSTDNLSMVDNQKLVSEYLVQWYES